ncbi:MAG: hypothetical protein JSS63_07860 [Bacteroidetes bacterium]|nr:hypothetical protein [Bacteroidota bacterium]
MKSELRKLEYFSKKYNSTFEEFEKKIKTSKKENFEEWDDYIEWNAFQNSYQDLRSEIQNKK